MKRPTVAVGGIAVATTPSDRTQQGRLANYHNAYLYWFKTGRSLNEPKPQPEPFGLTDQTALWAAELIRKGIRKLKTQ